MKFLLIPCAVLAATALYAQTDADAEFVRKAAGGGMAEVKLGQLAADKGTSDFVKQFGQRMVADHSKANDDLRSLGQKDGLTLPTDLPAEEQVLYDKLSALAGAAFDEAYVSAMKDDHMADIKEFQNEADTGRNPDVKAFATRTLPIVKMHLKMLQAKQIT